MLIFGKQICQLLLLDDLFAFLAQFGTVSHERIALEASVDHKDSAVQATATRVTTCLR